MPSNYSCDVLILGAGGAGLWLAHQLMRLGYHVAVIDPNHLGGVQSLASQGMIHGGQKYALTGRVTHHAKQSARMPERWRQAFADEGEVHLSGAVCLSKMQYMWAAGTLLDQAAVFVAAQAVCADTKQLDKRDYPAALQHIKGAVYALPEDVLDVKSLIQALAAPLTGRLFRGEISSVNRQGKVVISGCSIEAQAVICTAGAGNEQLLALLGERVVKTQRRPLKQVMVKVMEDGLCGHGITANPKPRVTITAHPVEGGYVWYLGGNIAERGALLSHQEAIQFAQVEMQQIFPHIDWASKEWAAYDVDRAEPYDEQKALPPGPYIEAYGRVALAWPTKLTFAPLLADDVIDWLGQAGVIAGSAMNLPRLPELVMGKYPWEVVDWGRLDA